MEIVCTATGSDNRDDPHSSDLLQTLTRTIIQVVVGVYRGEGISGTFEWGHIFFRLSEIDGLVLDGIFLKGLSDLRL